MRSLILTFTLLALISPLAAAPLPIDPLWKSETFRQSVTGSFGVDSRIEPIITTDEEFYLKKSSEEMAKDDRKAAIAILTESSILERSASMLFNVATLQFEEDDKEGAITHLKKALEIMPSFRDAHRNLAVVFVQQNKLDEAEKHLVRAIELGTNDGVTFGLLGYCHARREHHQSALDAYRHAMLTQPTERQWKLGAAQAVQALGHSREAANIFQSIINDSPTESGIWLAQADAWIHLDEPLSALVNLELVHRSGTLDPAATVSLGHLYLQNNLPALALQRYESAIATANPVILTRAVEALERFVQTADWTRAKTVATLIESSETYKPLLVPAKADKELVSRLTRSRALIELETGNAEAGAKLVENWLALEPLDGAALILLARFRDESDRREEAEMLLEQAERLPKNAAEAHLAHGQILVSASDYTAAVEHLEKSYKLKPYKSLAEYLAAVRELIDKDLR